MRAGSEPADDELVRMAKDGSLDAFNHLVDRYQSQVYILCYRLLGGREAAEDAAQEAFLSAYRALRTFSGGKFKSWLLRIAANASKDELRRRQRRPAASLDETDAETGLALDPPDPGETPEQRLDRIELGAELQRALDQLPFDQRQAIVLLDVAGYRYEEVASLMGTSPGTVKSRVSRGRERLRKLLAPRAEPFDGRQRREG